jgi:hypothetical protein
VSAHNLMTLSKRTSLNVYEADIFNCSRQSLVVSLLLTNCGFSWAIGTAGCPKILIMQAFSVVEFRAAAPTIAVARRVVSKQSGWRACTPEATLVSVESGLGN